MRTLFISDCHLDPGKPHVIERFQNFLIDEVPSADTLYILGDLFEYWIGDDETDQNILNIMDSLHTASKQTPIYLLHGNRDFLISKQFAQKSGCILLKQPTTIELQGTTTLIMHGDILCSDDRLYQWFCRITQNPVSKAIFNCLSRPVRKRIAHQLRSQSKKSVMQKAPEIMDVNENTVIRYMKRFSVKQLIHGHTHRPAIHEVQLGDTVGKRIVLGDWNQAGDILAVEDGTMKLIPVN